MTRKLVAALPEYSFDGPGMVPFARDIDNFWYKLSKIILTERRQTCMSGATHGRGDLSALDDAGTDVSKLIRKLLLRECNSISVSETDGLAYLEKCFDVLFERIDIDFRLITARLEHYEAFFASSEARIDLLKQDGAESISDIDTFRRSSRAARHCALDNSRNQGGRIQCSDRLGYSRYGPVSQRSGRRKQREQTTLRHLLKSKKEPASHLGVRSHQWPERSICTNREAFALFVPLW